ncbi:MAG: ComF family protein [Nitrospiraceae bacterium]|nr:ComF family protein [Nitrospiraceae bacterium]
MAFITGAFNAFLNGFFPASCPHCGLSSKYPRYSPFCSDCWQELKISAYNGPSCKICGEPFESEHGTVCGECLKDRPAFARVYAYGLFEGVLKEAIHSYKFGAIRRLSAPLSELLLSLELPAVDAVTSVPLSKKRLLERGFNQSMLVGKEIARISGAELLPHALKKVKDTPPQAELNRKERVLNLKGAFACGGEVEGKTVLLIDDVITTGTTARECSKALVKAGAKEVCVAALARTKK